jgi:hypothetical protein
MKTNVKKYTEVLLKLQNIFLIVAYFLKSAFYFEELLIKIKVIQADCFCALQVLVHIYHFFGFLVQINLPIYY